MKKSKSRTQINRREAYNFYRSLGYPPDEARNMRNRSSDRVIKEYSKERRAANKLFDEGDIYKPKKIYRPRVIPTKTKIKTFRDKIENYGITPKIKNRMARDNAINQDLYLKRIPALKSFFESKGVSWSKMLQEMAIFSSLGDWLDYLGERYQEET